MNYLSCGTPGGCQTRADFSKLARGTGAKSAVSGKASLQDNVRKSKPCISTDYVFMCKYMEICHKKNIPAVLVVLFLQTRRPELGERSGVFYVYTLCVYVMTFHCIPFYYSDGVLMIRRQLKTMLRKIHGRSPKGHFLGK